MNAPPINDVDLSALATANPLLVYAADLSELRTINNRAELAFTASGSGAVPYIGEGSATLELSAVGAEYWTAEGAGDITLSMDASGEALFGMIASGDSDLIVSAAGTGFQDWVSQLPLVQLQEVYRLIITGEPDGTEDLVFGGISSWQATNQADGRSSYLQAVIPAAEGVIDDLAARENGELVIQKGYRFEDGSERYQEILRSEFDTFRWDRGPRAFTATISGYLAGKPSESSKRTLTGIRSISMTNGKHRVRCDIDMFLQPGMTVTADDVTFKAGYINYYVNQTDKFCEVGER